MLRSLASLPRMSLVLVAIACLMPCGPARSQSATALTRITGRVLGPGARAVPDAVIVTSAGGHAVTGADGAFRLDVALPAGLETVRVTAVAGSGTGSLVASAELRARTGVASAGTLILEQAATCQPAWLPTFGSSPGVSDGGVTPGISALVAFDDGSGPALYVGGGFKLAGGTQANFIARWDGTHWSPLGTGTSSEVYALAVFDDGGGRALYAAGAFGSAGGVTARGVAKWDGSSWSPLGSGIGLAVQALAVFDDGSGPDLYAAGEFEFAGGIAASCIARWDGTSWSALGSGLDARTLALAVHDDGGGPALYAGGLFTHAGGEPAKRVAKWDGASWSALGRGMNGQVRCLLSFDDGSGPALFAGGGFTHAGDVQAARIARWDGAAWSALGSGMDGPAVETGVDGLAVFDDGSGPALVAGGSFDTAGGSGANSLARWNGTSWSPLGSGTDGTVRALAAFDAGGGARLVAGGSFDSAGGLALENVAAWDGAGWSALGNGLNGAVNAFAVFDDGSGPALHVAGEFSAASGITTHAIAKWTGSGWSPLGGGVTGGYEFIRALAVFDDGSGPALYAGGGFNFAGDEFAKYIAKWDGTQWSALGSGMATTNGAFAFVYALTVFDDGGGPALYAAGGFTIADGVPANRIAKFDGASWSALGSGISGPVPLVSALLVFYDGSGPALYAGGQFTTAGGVPASAIARWNGTGWSALTGGGMNDRVASLAAFDDGSGPALYAGGEFTVAGNVQARSIARWDGTKWFPLGSGTTGPFNSNSVEALAVFDDGSGPALHAGGNFTSAGGTAANRIAKWNGTAWSAMGGGTDGTVSALTVFDSGSGPDLLAGGSFGVAFDSQDSYLARWAGCPPPPPVWVDEGFALAGAAGEPQLSGTGTLVEGAPLAVSLGNAAPSAAAVLLLSLTSSPLPFKGGTLVPVPPLFAHPLLTGPAGDIVIPWPAWPAGASGQSLWFQYAIEDAGAVQGVALSNALRADVP